MSEDRPRDGHRDGLLLGVAAYGLWGAFPLFFPLLRPAGALEILAHRMVWSLVTMLLLVALLGRLSALRAIAADPRTRTLLVAAALTITVNWAVFIYGVNAGRVVETSLGYFVNPLVTVLIGVLLLRERLRPGQWLAVGVGGVAVAVLTWDYGRPPWVALALAVSFGTYGLAKKRADVGAVESLAFETAVVSPLAVGYLVWLGATGAGTFTTEGPAHALLLASAGLVTAVPLICFSAAATRIPMVSLGLLQYLTPVLQFAVGVLVVGEDMPPGRWAGFALVWLALAIFTVESLRHLRGTRAARRDDAPGAVA